ncbi:hypothetical protein BBF96_06040 [Anoxybacter fermentans]|uniref:N-acetyltransferase domain-containing protein n=1 Tax=Anoxybacter fermentans TaxID=1323375 RepID=A0A3Q9HPY9_9FIRM|nr:GNAT family N-acetyltransferase [Anoxybacter fermentans]AZR72993.1 hypothetical protein BBF96_06040 [Anoxybacter fermentans]
MNNRISIEIRKKEEKDTQDIIKLLELLPQYFSKPTLEAVRNNISRHDGYVATVNDKFVGFISFLVGRSNYHNGKISWMAVHPEFQNRGIGKKLLKVVENYLKSKNIEVIEVNTLAENSDYPQFHRTRQFYKKHGFIEVSRYKDSLDDSVEILVLQKKI